MHAEAGNARQSPNGPREAPRKHQPDRPGYTADRNPAPSAAHQDKTAPTSEPSTPERNATSHANTHQPTATRARQPAHAEAAEQADDQREPPRTGKSVPHAGRRPGECPRAPSAPTQARRAPQHAAQYVRTNSERGAATRRSQPPPTSAPNAAAPGGAAPPVARETTHEPRPHSRLARPSRAVPAGQTPRRPPRRTYRPSEYANPPPSRTPRAAPPSEREAQRAQPEHGQGPSKRQREKASANRHRSTDNTRICTRDDKTGEVATAGDPSTPRARGAARRNTQQRKQRTPAAPATRRHGSRPAEPRRPPAPET